MAGAPGGAGRWRLISLPGIRGDACYVSTKAARLPRDGGPRPPSTARNVAAARRTLSSGRLPWGWSVAGDCTLPLGPARVCGRAAPLSAGPPSGARGRGHVCSPSADCAPTSCPVPLGSAHCRRRRPACHRFRAPCLGGATHAEAHAPSDACACAAPAPTALWNSAMSLGTLKVQPRALSAPGGQDRA